MCGGVRQVSLLDPVVVVSFGSAKRSGSFPTLNLKQADEMDDDGDGGGGDNGDDGDGDGGDGGDDVGVKVQG